MASSALRFAPPWSALAMLAVSRLACAGVTCTVYSTEDLPDADARNGVCVTSAGTCTVHADIMQANANAADAPLDGFD